MSVDCDYCPRTFSSEDAYLEHLFYDHEQDEVDEEDKKRVIEKFKNKSEEETDETEKSSTNLTNRDEPKESETSETGETGDENEGDEKTSLLAGPKQVLQNKLVILGIVVVLVLAAVGGLYMAGMFPGFGPGEDPANNTSTKPAGYENLSKVEIQPVDVGESPGEGTIVMIVDGYKTDFTQSKYQTQNQTFNFDSEKDGVWHKNGRRVSLEYALHTVGIEVNETSMYYNGTLYQEDLNTDITYRVNGVEVDPQTVLLNDNDSIQIEVETQ